MWIARIEPDKPDHDKRTFDCSLCDYQETKIVKRGIGRLISWQFDEASVLIRAEKNPRQEPNK
jgi:hypothetical protein